eukprot:m.13127 g.13127  ORF g.13127 m.13127 type:complete len:540 (-) comp6132_c0_seq1:52-1671(-)
MDHKETSFINTRDDSSSDSHALLAEDGEGNRNRLFGVSSTSNLSSHKSHGQTLPSDRESLPQHISSQFLIEDGSSQHAPRFFGSTRCVVILVLWFANIVCYCDRINISVAILHMSEEQHWSASQQGYVLGAFFYGYVLTQIPGGKLAQRYGSSVVLRVAVVVWSLFTLLTPPAARTSLWALYLVRFGMGFGEGAALPAIHAALGRWVPVAERTRCVTFVTSGQLIGTVLALGASPLTARSWSAVFYFFGVLGLVWALLATWLLASAPETHPRISMREKAFIISGREETRQRTEDKRPASSRNSLLSCVNSPWCSLFCQEYSCSQHTHLRPTPPRPLPAWYCLILERPLVACFAALVTHNWGWYILLGWMPKYLHTLGADAALVGLYALLPYVLMFFADVSWGVVMDRAVARGFPVIAARKISQTIALAGPGIALLLLVMFDNPSLIFALSLLTVAITCSSCTHSGVWANVIDLAPAHAGYLLGLVNTVGNLPGLVGNITTGWMLEATGSWGSIFAVAVGVYMLGVIVFLLWAQARVLYL